MPTFEIELEDGRKFAVDAVDERSAVNEINRQHASGELDKLGIEKVEPQEELTPRNQRRKATREAMGGAGGGFNQVVPWQDEIMATLGTPVNMAARAINGEDISLSDAWSEEHQNIEQQNKEYDERHPVLSPVQNLVGGLAIAGPGRTAGMAPSQAAALPAAQRAAVPRFEGNAAQRIAKSTGTGAAIGAAYGSGEGDDLGERIDNAVGGAGYGAVFGAGGQIAGEGVRAISDYVARPIMRSINEPHRQARSQLTEARARDVADNAQALPERGLTPGEFQYAQERGYPVGNVDKSGENVLGLFESAYQRSPQARNRINDFVATRDRTMLESTEALIDGMLPSPGDIARRRANLRSGRSAVRPLYQEAEAHPNAQAMWGEGYSQLMGSDIGQEAMRKANKTLLDEAALAGGNRVRHPFVDVPVQVRDPATGQMVRTGETRIDIDPRLQASGFSPNLQYWDAVQKSLRAMSKAEKDAHRKNNINMIRGQLLDHLDMMTRDPRSGESLYARARTAAGRYLGAEDAAAAGEKIYKDAKQPSKSLDNILMRMQRWTDDEREEAAQSFLEALKDDMGHRARSSAGDAGHVDLSLNFLKSEKQRRVAEALLGPRRLAELEMHNMIQRVMQYRNKTARGNSATARRTIAEELAAPVAGGTLASGLLSGGDPMSMTFGGLMGVVGRKGLPAINNALKNRIAPHLADELIGDNPAAYQEVIRSLAGDQQVSNYLKLMTHPLRLAAGQFGGS
jgi:hypothetical protein